MNKLMLQEIEVMSIVSRGIDPRDGTFFETPRDPVLDAARLNYLAALKRTAGYADAVPATVNASPEYPNHGQPWAKEDDASLQEMWATGKTALDAGQALGRGEGAIYARLVALGVYETRSIARKADALRRPPVVRRQRLQRRHVAAQHSGVSQWA